jgi:hypothetical protein
MAPDPAFDDVAIPKRLRDLDLIERRGGQTVAMAHRSWRSACAGRQMIGTPARRNVGHQEKPPRLCEMQGMARPGEAADDVIGNACG